MGLFFRHQTKENGLNLSETEVLSELGHEQMLVLIFHFRLQTVLLCVP